MTTSSAASDENLVKMTTFSFQCLWRPLYNSLRAGKSETIEIVFSVLTFKADKFRVRMAGKDEKIDSYINAVFVDVSICYHDEGISIR